MPNEPSTPPTELLLREVGRAIAPLVRLLVRRGVDHPRFAAAMKRWFVQAALDELAREGAASPTVTALGLRSGLQRRDVKAQLEHLAQALPPKALSPTLPMQLFTRWCSDPATTDAEGAPLPLPLRSPPEGGPSVQSLAESLSKDVHALALLDELVRLGLARREGDTARLLGDAFVPSREFGQMLGALSRNLHDHAAAAAANVLDGGEPRFLEYSLVADELRPDSAEALQKLARRLWRSAHRRAVAEATAHVERDKVLGFDADAPETRIRFGVYFYAEPVARPPAAPPADPSGEPSR